MNRLTNEQRLQIIEFYYQNQCSVRNVFRALRPIYGLHNRPSEQTINAIVTKFRTQFTLLDITPTTRMRTVRTEENIASVSESVAEDREMSIRRRSQQLGLCYSTTWKILRKDLGVKPSITSSMRFIQFQRTNNSESHVGIINDDGQSFKDLGSGDMLKLIENFNLSEMEKNQSQLKEEKITSDIKILAPVTNPRKIIAIGLNYIDHCIEQNKEKPKEPMFFSKFSNCIVGPGEDVIYPPVTNALDYEIELAVIIGKKTKNVSKDKVFDHIFGYTVAQDISARDWQKQRNGGQFLLGKSMDTFLPLGPSIAHKSIISNPEDLLMICKVNGEIRQEQKTSSLIYKIDEMISYLSEMITLEAGDILLTGTPGGVGMHRKPAPVYLKVGDVIESEIEKVGKIVNKVSAK